MTKDESSINHYYKMEYAIEAFNALGCKCVCRSMVIEIIYNMRSGKLYIHHGLIIGKELSHFLNDIRAEYGDTSLTIIQFDNLYRQVVNKYKKAHKVGSEPG